MVAALVVEALLRAWRIDDAAWRLRLRTLALAVPLTWLPVLFLAAPFRLTAAFADHALFAGERWNLIALGAQRAGDLFLVLACGLGSALFLRDALPALRDLLRGGGPGPAPEPWQPAAALLERLVAKHATSLCVEPPEVRMIRAQSPVLLCEGVRRPTLVASAATVRQLAPDELDAALAHEVAHARFRDPAWGYALFAVRALLFFSPASQWLARTMVDDIERRADQAVARTAGQAEPLARAIVRLFETNHPPAGDTDASFERLFWRVRREGVERRCRRLRAGDGGPVEFGRFRLALAAAAVLALTFFIV